jgi:site-specific DNA recombinase
MNRRAAAYLRYSTLSQREASLDDQLRICRRYVEAQGDVLEEEFIARDAALSAVTIVGRDGLTELLEKICVRPPPVEYVVIDDLSRMSRDVGDMMNLVKRLRFCGVSLVGVADGVNTVEPASKMSLIFKAGMNEMFIDDLRKKTHRGLEGQALKGRSTGARVFGYRSVPVPGPHLDADGRPLPDGMRLVVQAHEAETVRRIFELARAGNALTKIVDVLVDEQHPCPNHGRREGRKAGWAKTSVRELLRNPRYCGTIIWNRRQWVKNPDTGKRISKLRPRNEWVSVRDPSQEIISPALFEEVQGVLAKRALEFSRGQMGRYKGRNPGATYSEYLLAAC